LHNPDFSRYADNCGALGIRVTQKSDLPAALKRLFAHNEPAMLEIIADPELI
jgi:pyruvate oxidase